MAEGIRVTMANAPLCHPHGFLPAGGHAGPGAGRREALPDEAVKWLQAYLRVDTINPPGNEAAGVQFFKAILDAEGIPYETAESAPGRGNIWARLKGGHSRR